MTNRIWCHSQTSSQAAIIDECCELTHMYEKLLSFFYRGQLHLHVI